MIRLPSRAAVLGLVASLFLSSIPLPAAAAMGKLAPVVPVNAAAGVGMAGAVRAQALAPVALSLSAPSHSAPVLALSAVAPTLAPSIVPELTAAQAALVAPRALAALPAANDAPGELTVIAGVEAAFTRLQGAKENGAAATGEVLNELFEGFVRKGAANDAPSVSGSASPLAPLAAAAKPAAADGPRWVFNETKPAEAPKTSWKRTFSLGFLGAVLPLVLTGVIVGVSMLLGHELNPNYSSPAAGLGTTPSIAQALILTGAAAVMAPVAEEIVFRAGLQGGLAKLTKFLRMGSFWVPAVLSSLIFVAIHETSDPVLFTTRFIHAMILAGLFKKEGVLASMAAHGFFNGILTLPLLVAAVAGLLPASAGLSAAIAFAGVLTAATVAVKAGLHLKRNARKLVSVPLLILGALALAAAGLLPFGMDPVSQSGYGVILAGLSGLAYAAVKAFGYLKAQRPDVASGAVVAKPFELRHGVAAAALLSAGFLVMPNPFWLMGLIGLVFWLPVKRVKG